MTDRRDQVLLRDGGWAEITPYHHGGDDDLELRRFAEGLSEQSVHRRFHSTGLPRDLTALVGGVGGRAYAARIAGTLVALGTYVPLVDPGLAEMALVVADAAHGRGVGTRVFERLAEEARREGVGRFLAIVLPDNRAMLGLLRGLGFRADRTFDSGEVEVLVDLDPGTGFQQAADRRDHTASTVSLEPILAPRSVAVIGASRERGTVGHELFRHLLAADFPGPVYPVNHQAGSVAGVAAYPSVEELPGPVDLAVVCLPAEAVLDAAAACIRHGVRGLVVVSGGFAEQSADGRALQDELRDTCRRAGVRLVGPNCLGVLTNRPGYVLNASLAPLPPPIGNVAVSSQSGGLGLAILGQAARLGIGVSAFASIGNKADVSSNDLLEAWEDDDATGVIALYLESFGNPRRFARIARRVSASKPIVAIKGGRSLAGARAAAPADTTVPMADNVAVDALFRQAGVVRTETLEELFDTVRFLSLQPLPAGNRVGVVTNSVSLGVLCADACEAAGLDLPVLGGEAGARLTELRAAAGRDSNPVGLAASATADAYRETVEAVLGDPGVDACVVIFIPSRAATVDEVALAVRDAAGTRPEKPVAACIVSADDPPASLVQAGPGRPVPGYRFPEGAAQALGRAAELAAFRRRPRGTWPELPGLRVEVVRSLAQAALADHETAWLPPEDVRDVCAALGITTAPGRFAPTAAAAGEAFVALGGRPVAVKLHAVPPLRGSDVGGVRLNVASTGDVESAFRDFRAALARRGSAEELLGVTVQRMVPTGVECVVGVTTDPTFGPLVGFGLGGIPTDLLGDVAFRITPLSEQDADEMIGSVRARSLLDGYRGGAPADVAALRDVLLRVAQLVELVPEVAELALDPVCALAVGEGAVTLDARIRVARA